ncbi:MAG TPA: PIN domain-containing protein [Geminicoccaceae bacterium]|nr:PIN domain-containing protein [Geminicoccus sp.]HMU49407.1 PIN domain-containing protein [Geminicoccaceae bacterium]
MTGRSFLDSNVFIYADDHRYPDKQMVASSLFEEGLASGLGVISTQVMTEYFNVVTSKLGVPATLAKRRIELMERLHVVQIDPMLILDAIDLHRLDRISIWDALIVRAAAAANCADLLTEDMQAGRRIAGVRIVNPFA